MSSNFLNLFKIIFFILNNIVYFYYMTTIQIQTKQGARGILSTGDKDLDITPKLKEAILELINKIPEPHAQEIGSIVGFDVKYVHHLEKDKGQAVVSFILK